MIASIGRTRLSALLFVLVAVGAVVVSLRYLHKKEESSRKLYEPKLLMLRIDEVPVPRGAKAPVEVMAGTTVSITCENVVPPDGKGEASYRFVVDGRVTESKKCALEAPIAGAVGSEHEISLEYAFKETGKGKPQVDRWEARVRVVPAREFLRVRNFSDKDGNPIAGHTVPREVIPNAEGVLKLDGPAEDYVVLFFVEAQETGIPVLQVTGKPSAEQRLEAISAQLKRVRRHGSGGGGYAAWPQEPILVGGPEDERAIFEVRAGLFRKKDVPAALAQLVSFEGRDTSGEAIVKILPKTVEEIKALAWRRWLSEPVRIVRAASAPPDADLRLIPVSPGV